MSESLRNPQLEPSDHCYVLLQDHGANNGGWGPAAVAIPSLGLEAAPFVYTGDSQAVLEAGERMCRVLAQKTGKPTKWVRYSHREDLLSIGGSQ